MEFENSTSICAIHNAKYRCKHHLLSLGKHRKRVDAEMGTLTDLAKGILLVVLSMSGTVLR
jgi:hypothetical protein